MERAAGIEETPRHVADDEAPGAPPAKRRKPDRRRARTRAAITGAASELFDANGFHPTTVDDIARAAGTSVGTIYFHFGSKEGVAAAIAANALRGFEAELETARDSASPIDRLIDSFDVYFRFALEHPAAFLSLSQDQPADPESTKVDATEPVDQVRAFLELAGTDLREAIDSGELPDLPVDDAVALVLATCNGLAARTLRTDELALTREAAERTLRLGRRALLSGLGYAHAES